MARYRKIDTRVWGDEDFLALSPPQEGCGRYLWFYLLTSPETTNIPGLYRAGRAAMAESLGWSTEAFGKAFDEAFAQGLVEADWKARVIWIPNAIRYNEPESPNVVLNWRVAWDEIPECELKLRAWGRLKDVLDRKVTRPKGNGKGSTKAFLEAFLKACPKPSPKAMANQEQEQEQEQETTPATVTERTPAPLRPVDDPPSPWTPGSPIASLPHLQQAASSWGMRIEIRETEKAELRNLLAAGAITNDEAEEARKVTVRKRPKHPIAFFLGTVRNIREDVERVAARGPGAPPKTAQSPGRGWDEFPEDQP